MIDVSKAIRLADDAFYLVIDRFDPGIAQPWTNRVENVLLVSTNLAGKIADYRNPAVACPPKPRFQLLGGCCFCIIQFGVARGRPNNSIRIMIHSNGDVLVSLFVAGFIDANPHKAGQAAGRVVIGGRTFRPRV